MTTNTVDHLKKEKKTEQNKDRKEEGLKQKTPLPERKSFVFAEYKHLRSKKPENMLQYRPP